MQICDMLWYSVIQGAKILLLREFSKFPLVFRSGSCNCRYEKKSGPGSEPEKVMHDFIAFFGETGLNFSNLTFDEYF